MKKISVKWRFLISVIIIIIAITVANYKNRFDEIRKSNRHTINEVKENYLETKEDREVGIEKLLDLLNEGKYLSSKDKIEIENSLALMYLSNSDYQNGIRYSIGTIHLASKLENKYIVANNLINLTNTFIELEGYETAEETINYVLGLDIENKEESDRIKEHAYINLASIYSQTQKEDKALELISESMNYSRTEDSNYVEKILVRKIISARSYFYKGDVQKSDEILRGIEVEFKNIKQRHVTNISIPYLRIKAKVEFYKGNIKDGIRIAEAIFKLCDNENKVDIKVSYMKYILGDLKKYKSAENTQIIDEYKDRLLDEYNKLILLKNKESVFNIINNYDNQLQYLKVKDTEIMLYKNVAIATIIISIAFYLLGNKLRKVRIQGNMDALTNVFNRKKFDYEYNKVLNSGKGYGLIVIDIDNFKELNDKYGHSFGDVVLKGIAQNMNNLLSKNDMMFRYGGEEFCVICKSKTLDETAFFAETMRRKVESMTWENGINITISLGVSHTEKDKELFNIADENLYKSKASGRNRVTF